MRSTFTVIHRWAGLFIAVFLAISGITGAIISWDHELDEWLNAHLYDAKSTGQPAPPLELVRRVEAADPRAQVTFFPLAFEDGHTASLSVTPRVDPETKQLYPLDYNQVFVDPASGETIGKRYWGAISLDRENILPFLYKLHYSMHIPDFANFDRWGLWFMGVVGVVWLFDCFVGFYLTLPARAAGAPAFGSTEWRERWRPAWRIKRGASRYRFNFDVHRAFGLWLWALLFLLAFTSISMNLNDEVVRPILSRISTLTPDAFDDKKTTPLNEPIEPKVSFEQAIAFAEPEARRRGWDEPLGSAFYGPQHGLYAIMFFKPGDDHGSGGMGVKMLILDGMTGAFAGERVPWKGTNADIFMQLQFPLHSGRIAGIPGRIAVSILGLIVATLSITGIYIWLKKRAARRASSARGDVDIAAARPVAGE